jgi:hypothetical protein
VEANVRKKLKAAPITRAFKDIAKQAILRMAKQLEDGEVKVISTSVARRTEQTTD